MAVISIVLKLGFQKKTTMEKKTDMWANKPKIYLSDKYTQYYVWKIANLNCAVEEVNGLFWEL